MFLWRIEKAEPLSFLKSVHKMIVYHGKVDEYIFYLDNLSQYCCYDYITSNSKGNNYSY